MHNFRSTFKHYLFNHNIECFSRLFCSINFSPSLIQKMKIYFYLSSQSRVRIRRRKTSEKKAKNPCHSPMTSSTTQVIAINPLLGDYFPSVEQQSPPFSPYCYLESTTCWSWHIYLDLNPSRRKKETLSDEEPHQLLRLATFSSHASS